MGSRAGNPNAIGSIVPTFGGSTAAFDQFSYKEPVRLASTANLPLSGLAAIDGVVPVAGDRILVKNQAAGAENGIYVAAAGSWVRATDFDEDAEVNAGSLVPVEEGATQADTLWISAELRQIGRAHV